MFFLLSQLRKGFKTNEQRHASVMLWEIWESKTQRNRKQNDSINKIQPVQIVVVEVQLLIEANLRNKIIITSGEE